MPPSFDDLTNLYEHFAAIPTYVEVMMIFVIAQFVVVSAVAIFGVWQLRRIAEVAERAPRTPSGTYGPAIGMTPIAEAGVWQQAPQYGSNVHYGSARPPYQP